MRVLGVTLTSSSRPFPDPVDIGADVLVREDDGERFVSSDLLDLYFAPATVFETVPDPDPLSNDWADHPYAFRFSREADGAYEPIKPIIPFNAFLFEGTSFGPLAVTDEPSELVVSGNHVLQATSAFPERATHVELWFRTEREREFSLMRRVALDSLVAWRRYLRVPD